MKPHFEITMDGINGYCTKLFMDSPDGSIFAHTGRSGDQKCAYVEYKTIGLRILGGVNFCVEVERCDGNPQALKELALRILCDKMTPEMLLAAVDSIRAEGVDIGLKNLQDVIKRSLGLE